MNTKDKYHDVLPFCYHCKELAETGRAQRSRMELARDYVHFFSYGDVPYLMRFVRCSTCRRPYVHFMPYNGYLPGRGMYYPFPIAYPIK